MSHIYSDFSAPSIFFSMRLLHKLWLLIGERVGCGIAWQSHSFLNAIKSRSTVNIEESHDFKTYM